jgi:hypothetical protein
LAIFNIIKLQITVKKISINFRGMSGVLSSSQMKQIIGGNVIDDVIDDEGDSCIKKGETCHQASGSKCCKGSTCKDQGNEQGSKCA